MKKWIILEEETPKLRDKIAKDIGVSPLTAQILINRGIKDTSEAETFLKSTLFDLPSPFLIKGMDAAVERIKKAIGAKEKIAIYGDYDVDGVTSTSLLYLFLKNLGLEPIYYNPDRIKEGYGVNLEAIKRLKKEGASLIISGDCGITALREVKAAREMGVDFIVTDHHRPPDILPDAVSVLNPHQPGCQYPGKEIAGVGVVFNLIIALRRVLRDAGFFKKRNEPNLADYLDFVALGTVSDCAPLTYVNRIFVKHGIKRISASNRPGILALKEVGSVKGDVSSYDIAFRLGPRINASGRLKSAGLAVEILTSEKLQRSREIAKKLDIENSNRQQIEEKILSEAIQKIESNLRSRELKSFVLASPNWHIGVIGIVASRLVERYVRPTVLITLGEDGLGKGSARGVEGLDLYRAISQCREFLKEFGGHELAAGLSIRKEDIEGFRNKFEKVVGESLSEEDLVGRVKIDAKVELRDITKELIKELELLAPYGIGNPEPLFCVKGVEVLSRRLFKDKHLSLKLKQNTSVLDAIWFGLEEKMVIPDRIDVAFTPEINEWNDRREIRLRVRDIKPFSI